MLANDEIPDLRNIFPEVMLRLVNSSIIVNLNSDKTTDYLGIQNWLFHHTGFDGNPNAVRVINHHIETDIPNLNCRVSLHSIASNRKVSIWHRHYIFLENPKSILTKRQIHVFFNKSLQDQAVLFKLSF